MTNATRIKNYLFKGSQEGYRENGSSKMYCQRKVQSQNEKSITYLIQFWIKGNI